MIQQFEMKMEIHQQCFGASSHREGFINNMARFGQTWRGTNSSAVSWSGTGLSWWFAVRE